MDVAWQDSGVGSFLDSSGTGPSNSASFANDGGALWSSSADSPAFSGQPVLWESSSDSPADSRISGLTADSTNGTDTSALLASGWIADAGSGFAGGSGALDGGLLWTGASSDTSSSLASNGGVGLGALDLGASSGVSLWHQFIDQFAGGSATGMSDGPHLLWAGASEPLLIVPPFDGLQSLHIAATDSLPFAGLGNFAPTQLVWSGATGLTAGPSLTDAAPTTPLSGAGSTGASSGNLPLAGAGSHA